MLSRFKKSRTAGLVPQRLVPNISPDTYSWKNHKKKQVIESSGPVSIVEWNPMEPTMLIIAASISLSAHLNVGEDTYRERRICKLDDTIQGACFRPDGRLVAVGSTDGPIMVIDVSTKVVLRKLEGHRAPVKSLVFLPNLVQLVSTSDDRTIRIWDIPTGREVRCISHNSDFVRSCSALEERFATGSYDHTVSIWCPDSPTPCATFDHGDPVEAVCLFPNGKLVASAGCSSVKIWRIDDGILLREITMHHKTISCMHISKDSKYLITGSLDQSVKILRLDDFQIAHQFKFPFAVLCLSVSMDFTRLAVGLSNGTSVVLSFSNSTPRILYRQPRVTDASLQNLSNDAMVLPTPKPRKVSKLDSYLRSFEYHNALSYTLQNEQANGLIPVLVELTRRGSLKQALSGRTEVDLIPLLDVITHKLCVPRYSSVLLEAAFEVVEIYSNVIGQSKLFDTSLKRLCQSIMRQVRVQKSLIHLEGALSLLESVNRQMLSNH